MWTQVLLLKSKVVYFKYLQTKSLQSEYIIRENRLCREQRQKLKRKTRDKYVGSIEYDVHAEQNMAFRIMEYVSKF